MVAMQDVVEHPWAPGAWVYINYGVAVEPWHEWLVLCHVGGCDYVMYIPDCDIYVET